MRSGRIEYDSVVCVLFHRSYRISLSFCYILVDGWVAVGFGCIFVAAVNVNFFVATERLYLLFGCWSSGGCCSFLADVGAEEGLFLVH